jgi:hypothetical protein
LSNWQVKGHFLQSKFRYPFCEMAFFSEKE